MASQLCALTNTKQLMTNIAIQQRTPTITISVREVIVHGRLS